MLARGGSLPPDDGRWAFEPKWDGFRALVQVARGARVWSRRGSDLTDRFPEVEGIAGAVPADTVLDGELVVFGADGRPDFEGICRRGLLGLRGPPATFVAFDVLRLGARDALASRYAVRRRMLADLDFIGAAWVTTPSYVGEGDAVLEATRARGLEGVVAKRLDSLYKPGVRSRLWLKIKNYRTGRFLIGGVIFTGERATVLVGVPAPDGALHYAGAVEVLSRFQRAEILELLRARPGSPFRGWSPPARFVEPDVAVEIRYLALEPSGLRHATLLGLSPIG